MKKGMTERGWWWWCVQLFSWWTTRQQETNVFLLKTAHWFKCIAFIFM